MTASNLEPTLTSATSAGSGECTREHVTERVTSGEARDPPKRVTVAAGDKTSDNSDQCPTGETTCCRVSEQPRESEPKPIPDPATRSNAAHKQQYYAQPLAAAQPNAISIYPPAHNFVHYPLAPPPLPFQPQLNVYHQLHPPYFTWACPTVSGNYQQQQLLGGGHYYYAHQAQVQPFVAQHQLCGPAIYQNRVDATSATETNNHHHHQYVTQTAAPPDKGASDDDDGERQSHGSTPPPINEISATACNASAGIGSSAASLDCAHASKVTPAVQTTQQSDKSPTSSAPLDTAALDGVARGPIQRNDKCRDRAAQQQQCEPNKISYQGENDNEPASSQLEGVSKDDDERGSCRGSSLCDEQRGDTLANYHDDESTAAAAGTNSTSCHRHQHRHQNSISDSTVTSGAGRGGTCTPEADQEGRPRANLMVEPARGGGSSSESDENQQQEKAGAEEAANEAEGRLPSLKEANLDEIDPSINNQLANGTAQPSTESHQISINGTTFYHVDPSRLFLPAQPPPPPPPIQQHQLPFLLSYYGPTNAYHTSHQLPANNYFQRPLAQPSPYAASYHQQPTWYSPPQSHNRLILQPQPPPTVDYNESWLHHAAYQQQASHMGHPTSHQQHQQLLFASSPYLGGSHLRPIIHHHHSHDQAQVPPLQPMQPPTVASTTSVSQLKLGYNLIPLLPIQAIPTRVRQAYGMDKVWQDEFEQMFAQFISQVVWTLVEVETNPNVRASSRILDYKNRYVVRVDGPPAPAAMSSSTCESSGDDIQEQGDEHQVESKQVEETVGQDGDEEEEEADENSSCRSLNLGQSQLMMNAERNSNCESDCDSGAVLNSSSTTSGSSFETTCCQSDELSNTSSSGDSTGPNVRSFTPLTEADGKGAQQSTGGGQLAVGGTRTKFPLKFRMFIDSAKVRFCCETCGHGWTSMKGRVVFWYELFELVDGFDPLTTARSSAPFGKHANDQQQHGVSNLIGYCAYKLFGQQCDVCKVENRFERPMWYPEEVTKVLCNLYNKIGQLYFGFRMPTIDKQRRAGKPKTSHNSLLCQACHDGVCTDRK